MRSDLDDHARARVGSAINPKYRLERLIGSGGMAAVYLGSHRNGNRVAIKVLHPHVAIDAELRDRFLREGYVANKVDHRGAVRVLDDDTAEDGTVFLVMELLEGETLDARFERSGRRLGAREVCEFAHQLLDVLAAAHSKGVVHRDIKPENLFLTSEGVVKVLDFGIARLREAGGAHAATQTGRMIGTPAFMPPEQALGRSKEIDGQTDLWAVGATMFTLVSGHHVHEAETMEETLIRAGSQQARPVASVAPGLSPAITGVIDRALRFSRQHRWADAGTMQTALEDAYRTTYGTTIATARSSWRPSVPRADAFAATVLDPSLAAGGGVPVRHSWGPAPADPLAARVEMAAPTGPSTTAGVASGIRGPLPVEAGTARAPRVGVNNRTAFRVGVGAVGLATAIGLGLLVARIPRGAVAPSPASVGVGAPPPTVVEVLPPPPAIEGPPPSKVAAPSAPPTQPPAAAALPQPRRATTPTPSSVKSASTTAPSSEPAPAPTPTCHLVQTSVDTDGVPHFQKVCN
jgi:eukaryotic-like serine/threonine-protein kinase